MGKLERKVEKIEGKLTVCLNLINILLAISNVLLLVPFLHKDENLWIYKFLNNFLLEISLI